MSNMKEYVAAFIFDLMGNRVLLIKKNKPIWQAGLYNGIGGSIEEGEYPKNAIIREVNEEVNLDIKTWKSYASLEGDGWKVHWFYTFTNKIAQFKNNAQEIAEIFNIKLLPNNTISNVPYLMHMALNFEKGNSNFLQIKEITY